MRGYSKCFLIVGILAIWTIKLVLRPYVEMDILPQFLLGIAPNLIGSFLIPFGAYWLLTHPYFFNGRLLRYNFLSDCRLVCLWGFTLVLVNEYLQLIPLFGRTFDYFDIIFSAIGLTAAYYSFSLMQRKLSL